MGIIVVGHNLDFKYRAILPTSLEITFYVHWRNSKPKQLFVLIPNNLLKQQWSCRWFKKMGFIWRHYYIHYNSFSFGPAGMQTVQSG